MKKRNRKFLLILCTLTMLSFACVGGACVATGTKTSSSASDSKVYHKITYMCRGEVFEERNLLDGLYFRSHQVPEMEGYEFHGWFFDEAFTDEATEEDIITSDVTVYAKILKRCCVSLVGKNWSKSYYCLEGNTSTLYEIYGERDGYTLTGAYTDEDCLVEYTEPTITDDTTIYLTYDIITYTITYDTQSANPKTYTVEDEFQLTAPFAKSDEKIYNGWKTQYGGVRTEITKGTYGDLNLTANWVDYYRDGSTFYCGQYPQTIKPDDVTIESVGNKRVGSDGYYYYYAETDAEVKSSVFSNGKEIQPKTGYYFRIEPIQWTIVGEKDGVLQLASKYVLDGHIYDTRNSYSAFEGSDLQDFLNVLFLSRSTTYKQNKHFVEHTMEWNGPWFSTYTTTNTVYLATTGMVNKLAETEFKDELQKEATDYARISGMWLAQLEDEADENKRYASWWLLTPQTSYDTHRYVNSNGKISEYTADKSSILGVAPFIDFDTNKS